MVDRLYEEYGDDVQFAVLDFDENTRLADGFGVQYVPTFVFVDAGGQVIETFVGAREEDVLASVLDRLR